MSDLDPSRYPLGFTRNRSHPFNSFRTQIRRDSPPGADAPMLLQGGPRAPPDCPLVHRATAVDNQFASLESALCELSLLYSERLRPSFDSPTEVDARIGAVTAAVSRAIERLRGEIKGPAADPAHRQLEAAMRKGHAARLRRIVVQFRDMQADYIGRLQAAERRGGFGEISIADDSGELTVDADIDAAFTGDQSAQVLESRIAIDQRNRQIEEVTTLVAQLTEMMGDLATLIADQGTMLDRIDGFLEAAVDEMHQGNENLAQAEQHQKSSTKCFVIYMIAMIILILILGTVILIRKGKKEGGTQPETQ
jgi:syntaxin 16